MQSCVRHRSAERVSGMSQPDPNAGGLQPFRHRLDALDSEIARLLGERFEVCRQIAYYKRAHDIPMMQPQRVVEVRERYLARGAQANLPGDFVEALFELLISATCRMEDELIDAPQETAADNDQRIGAPAAVAKPEGQS